MTGHEEQESEAREETTEPDTPTPSEQSEPSEETRAPETRTPSEQSEEERASGEEESAGARLEGRGGSSREERSSSQAPPAGAAEAEGESRPGEERAPLFTGEEANQFRERWANVQAGFVDQPRQMVEQADDLVSDLMQQLTTGFSDERTKLEQQWSEGEEASTEELRVALRRYRSFFNRLLSA